MRYDLLLSYVDANFVVRDMLESGTIQQPRSISERCAVGCANFEWLAAAVVVVVVVVMVPALVLSLVLSLLSSNARI